ncbi:hypothetical protein EVAR_8949_1 [Eumeta japonica]|uniref:Uncharacterized protein n=1 Tax=Eumeta variegata TaxID=151549 RepID=A0A4C1U0P9_EUMVA|nr:hypothetical protein EVAR_8949_1 [Eumeta japonica]
MPPLRIFSSDSLYFKPPHCSRFAPPRAGQRSRPSDFKPFAWRWRLVTSNEALRERTARGAGARGPRLSHGWPID